jgi:class 3 adenylate cyclase/tetratricopeptide (TPR) repeat protein
VNDTPEKIAATIAALEAQRAVLGDAVVDMALAPLRRELAARRAGEQQLKQVSVLFVDVVGSTAMGQKLGPEEIHAVMDGALERFTAVVQSHHGRVLQYTGDGMLAAFGSEQSSEDDVENAVRAGLGIIEEARRQAPQVRQRHGVPDFNVRAGIHTGRVLLGGGVDADGSIRGASVNIAARMEQSAPPGRLRISHDTWRHVRGLFATSEQEAVQVKGVDHPVRSYLVERAAEPTFVTPTRGVEGIATRMVGRDAELSVLGEAFAAAAADRTLAAVTVVGEAGLGKSRLLAEFRQGLEEADRPCWLLLARAHPRSALHSYGQLRDLLAWQLQITEADGPDVAREKFARGLASLLAEEGEGPVHALGHLIGLDFSASPHVQELLSDEERLRAIAFDAASLALRRGAAARNATAVVVVDDLHWADEGSIAFARHLLEHNREMPLLCLFLTRPTLFERDHRWCEGDLAHRRIDLHPLDKTDSRELSEVLLQRIDGIPDALRAIVTGGAEGNPFYMEELVKMLIDDGVIVADPEGWHVLPERLVAVQVPPTLTGVLQARLDALPAGERAALQQAAIVGHVFSDQALGAIEPAALKKLPALLHKRLIVVPEARPGTDAGDYVFQHHLLHQVTYDSVLKEPRRQGHERVGAFWSARAEVASPQQVTPAACRALAEAHDHRQLADPVAFANWFDAQFYNYYMAYAGLTLRPLVQSVVALCERHHGADHVETARALTNLGRVALQRGEMETAEGALRRALDIQEHALGPEHLDTARTVAVLGGYHQGRGDYASAETYFARALAIRERVLGAEHPLTLTALEIEAHLLSELGKFDDAERLSRRVLQVRERTLGPDALETAAALTALGDVLVKMGDPAAAEPLLRRALAVQLQSLNADNPDIGLTLWHLAEALRVLGRCDEAEPLARRTLEISEDSFGPAHEWTAWGLISLAEIRSAQGAFAEAADLAARAAQIVQRLFGAEHAVLGSTLNLQGRALLSSGEHTAAEPVLARALAIQSNLATAGDAALATGALLAQAREKPGQR